MKTVAPEVTPIAPDYHGKYALEEPISKVVLLNVRLDYDLDVDEEIHWRLGAIVEDELRKKGFAVVSYEKSVRDWIQYGMAQGGFYDAVTGEFYADRWEAAFAAWVDQYVRDEQVGGVVYVYFAVVKARFTEPEGVAYFCNTAQSMRDYRINYLEKSSMERWVKYIDASCVEIRLGDLKGGDLYSATGGVEVHGMLTPSGLQAVGAESILAADDRVRDGVSLAARGLSAPFGPRSSTSDTSR